MTLVKLAGGRIVDPANKRDGVGDLFLRDGRIVADPGPGAKLDRTYDLGGRVVMAGAIDMHSHICGGKVNLARTLLIEDHRADSEHRTELKRGGGGRATPSTFVTGYRYAEMGYTAAFEPAMVAGNARHAHAELADTPLIDKGCYVMLGNEDVLLRMMAANEGQSCDQRLCRLDAAGDPGAGGEGRQSRRHQRLQVQHPRARPRHRRPALRRDAAPHHRRPGARRA